MEVTLKIRAEREEDFAVLRAIMDFLERNKEPQAGAQAGAQSMAGQPWTEEAWGKWHFLVREEPATPPSF